MPVEEQVVSIFAGTKGYLDDIPVADVIRFEKELLEYVRTTHSSLLADIKSAGVPDGLADAIESFKADVHRRATNDYAVDPTALDVDEVGEARVQQDPRHGVI